MQVVAQNTLITVYNLSSAASIRPPRSLGDFEGVLILL
jgi:hypothetical protein